MHPSSSSLCADPPPQKSSSVSLASGGKRRAALSDASNVVADVTSSRPNHRQKRIATNGRKKNARDLLDDDVQQKGRIIAKERKEVFVLDALLDELDGDCAL